MVMRDEPLVPKEDAPCFDASAMQILIPIILLVAGFRTVTYGLTAP